jgi:hypothetical protein
MTKPTKPTFHCNECEEFDFGCEQCLHLLSVYGADVDGPHCDNCDQFDEDCEDCQIEAERYDRELYSEGLDR